ncbi:hypothetical protein EJ06DRAFT_529987 [Trichodelitschia bisporula]|uniref:Acyltransferase MbtK/IucB-like conserved domain-containing protein n=1 Tax=Trichodelitschia bisporula TaxID=703511 RepID=A0A6G1HYF4_9PEZI|nr:hypothetical protein EJ06DRAFT_529987 [Trichodelitschia bisporula]
MAPHQAHLPNGLTLTVSPVFGGLYFRANELTSHNTPFPPGWTVILHTEDNTEDDDPAWDPHHQPKDSKSSITTPRDTPDLPTIHRARHRRLRFTKPTMHNDHLFISSISQSSHNELRPANSPTRQIAMMLWATLWWYFHQPEPDLLVTNKSSEHIADSGKPRGEWRINIKREGVFSSKTVLPKLERMGLIASADSCVGADLDERSMEGWTHMFVSRRAFWQLDARIYLFSLVSSSGSPFPSGTPHNSRPGSPNRQTGDRPHSGLAGNGNGGTLAHEMPLSPPVWPPQSSSQGPFHSTSHLPTYYPPPPPQFVFTGGIRHPLRPKPPRQGETFYTRFVPSVGQYLSFRVASMSRRPQQYRGPVAGPAPFHLGSAVSPPRTSQSESAIPTMGKLLGDREPGAAMVGAELPVSECCDTDLLHRWMNDPRVSDFWGEAGPPSQQEEFLRKGLRSTHSFPAIGCWDGRPFGYFEIYWAKEDQALGVHLSGEVGNYDRGIHCLVGEQEFRGPHRVPIWLSALVHYCWLADNRTEVVMMEPRVDNEKLVQYAEGVGFFKERQLSLEHKQSWLLKIRRDAWQAPAL